MLYIYNHIPRLQTYTNKKDKIIEFSNSGWSCLSGENEIRLG